MKSILTVTVVSLGMIACAGSPEGPSDPSPRAPEISRGALKAKSAGGPCDEVIAKEAEASGIYTACMQECVRSRCPENGDCIDECKSPEQPGEPHTCSQARSDNQYWIQEVGACLQFWGSI